MSIEINQATFALTSSLLGLLLIGQLIQLNVNAAPTFESAAATEQQPQQPQQPQQQLGARQSNWFWSPLSDLPLPNSSAQPAASLPLQGGNFLRAHNNNNGDLLRFDLANRQRRQASSGPSADLLLNEKDKDKDKDKDKKKNKRKQSVEGAARKKKIISECLSAHNKLRRLHGVPDLEWDEKLAKFAQKRSNYIAKSDGDKFGHPPDLIYGENLFWYSALNKGCNFMVRGWYDEIKLYNFDAPSFSSETGHFTQVVWHNTRRVGCAFAKSTGPRGGLYLTCNYDPPGNFIGEFEENVPRPLESETNLEIDNDDEKNNVTVRQQSPPTSTSTSTTTSTTTTTTTTVKPLTTGEPNGLTKPKKNKNKNKNKKTTTTNKKNETDKSKEKEKEKDKDKNKSNKQKKKRKKGKKEANIKLTSTTASPLATLSTSTTKVPQQQ